jgi:hypothetical protein
MTNTQLYLAIGVPILFNFGIMLTFFILLNSNINARLDGLRSGFNQRFDAIRDESNQQFSGINQRFDDMRDLWRAKLRRVEEVIDARLKHLEEK